MLSGMVVAENNVNTSVNEFQTGNTVQNVSVEDNNGNTQIETSSKRIDYKKPVSKRKIAKKFLLAMFGVALSSFLIFFMLTFYNKIYGKMTKKINTPKEMYPLKSPDDMSEAIKIFIDKTKW